MVSLHNISHIISASKKEKNKSYIDIVISIHSKGGPLIWGGRTVRNTDYFGNNSEMLMIVQNVHNAWLYTVAVLACILLMTADADTK